MLPTYHDASNRFCVDWVSRKQKTHQRNYRGRRFWNHQLRCIDKQDAEMKR